MLTRISRWQIQIPSGPGYIPVLDGWRAIAILLVLIYHAMDHMTMHAAGAAGRLFDVVRHLGPFGVLIFFVISGYLITGRIISQVERDGVFNVGDFYRKRFRRILPVAYLYLAVLLVLDACGVIHLTLHDAAAPVFLTNYVRPHSWYTGHFWSLAIEEHFYLIWPSAILLIGWRRAFWFGLSITAAVALWRPWVLSHTTNPFAALQRTDLRLDYLMYGALAAIALRRWPHLVRAVASFGKPAVVLLLCFGILFTAFNSHVELRSLQAIS